MKLVALSRRSPELLDARISLPYVQAWARDGSVVYVTHLHLSSSDLPSLPSFVCPPTTQGIDHLGAPGKEGMVAEFTGPLCAQMLAELFWDQREAAAPPRDKAGEQAAHILP